jgi:hypothetical protein
MSWTNGGGANACDVYLGTSSTLGSGDYRGRQSATTYDPGTLAPQTTYYWRVDARGAGGGVTAGDVWRFTTSDGSPLAPVNPSPAHGSVDQSVESDLAWADGGGAASFDVYFGTDPVPGPAQFRGTQAAVTYEMPALEPYVTYYWRVDARNDTGVAQGSVWQFRTRAYDADFDGDADVDQADFGHLQACLAASVGDTACDDARLNEGDTRVDELDLAVFMACYSGPTIEALPGCRGG